MMPIPENKPERNSSTAGVSRCSNTGVSSQRDERARRYCELAKGCEARGLEGIAVEKIVRVEGNQAAGGVDDVDAGFFHGAHVEGGSVEELHDQDAKNIFVAKSGGGDSARADGRDI